MITPAKAIENIGELLNPIRTQIPVYYGNITAERYKVLASQNARFVTITALPLTFRQMQEGIINVNLFASDKGGVTDMTSLDLLLLQVKPLIEDAYINQMATTLMVATVAQEQTSPYSYYNLRVQVNSANLVK